MAHLTSFPSPPSQHPSNTMVCVSEMLLGTEERLQSLLKSISLQNGGQACEASQPTADTQGGVGMLEKLTVGPCGRSKALWCNDTTVLHESQWAPGCLNVIPPWVPSLSEEALYRIHTWLVGACFPEGSPLFSLAVYPEESSSGDGHGDMPVQVQVPPLCITISVERNQALMHHCYQLWLSNRQLRSVESLMSKHRIRG